MAHGHEIVKCSCGAVIMQCRCAAPDKPVRVVKDGCAKCKSAAGGGVPITPYCDLRAGDTFIRVGQYPVLLRDIEGKRHADGTFTPSGFGGGRPFGIKRMVKKGAGDGWLDEESLSAG